MTEEALDGRQAPLPGRAAGHADEVIAYAFRRDGFDVDVVQEAAEAAEVAPVCRGGVGRRPIDLRQSGEEGGDFNL